MTSAADDDAPTLEELRKYIEDVDPHTVHAALGIRLVTLTPEEVAVEVDVDERLFQHAGIVHGGIYVLLAESAASCCAALNVDVKRQFVSGQEVSASHLSKVTDGVLRATARPLRLGRTAHVFDCRVENQDGKLISWVRITVAVRDIPEAA